MPTGWDKQVPERKMAPTQNEAESRSNNDNDNDKSLGSDKAFEMARLETFIPEEPRRTLDDLIVPKSVHARINTALNRIRFHDELYNQWNLKKIDPNGNKIAINFFGSPGTGKTFCAEAIAHYLGKKIIKVNYAEIESKYVGETPKNITAAFRKASETSSVLFFDEADSILGKRLTNVTQSADHGVNVSRSVMLLELDKFDGVVLFATNLAKNYDGAFIRRILAHIEFELPDEECRLRLWKYLLPLEVPCNSGVTIEWLAKESEGLAGGDIRNIVIAAASRAVERQGLNREVLQTDFLEEIEHIKISKQKISSSSVEASRQPMIITEKVVSPEELPLDVQEKFRKVVDQ